MKENRDPYRNLRPRQQEVYNNLIDFFTLKKDQAEEPFFYPSSILIEQAFGANYFELSEVERRVLALILNGQDDRDIAEILKASPHAVSRAKREISSLLDVESRHEIQARVFQFLFQNLIIYPDHEESKARLGCPDLYSILF